MAADQNSIPKDLRPLSFGLKVADGNGSSSILQPAVAQDISGSPRSRIALYQERQQRGFEGHYPMTYTESMVTGLSGLLPISSSAIEILGSFNAFAGNGNEPLTDRFPYDMAQGRSFTLKSNASDSQSNNVHQHQRQTSVPSTSQDSHCPEATDDFSTKKVKFLCSFGGKILPRPSDGVLRYVGGQTRIISLRKGIGFQVLFQKLVDAYGQPVVIKYQLPQEDLDALISVSCDEDLDNMMEEYDKLLENSRKGSPKFRVFLFPASEPESSDVVQYADHQEAGQRYVEALNGIPESTNRIKESTTSATSTQSSDCQFNGDASDNFVPSQGDAGSNLLSSKIPVNDAPRLANDALRLANDAPSVVNDAPRSANDAPRFANGDPRLANGDTRLAYRFPNQLIFGEDAASSSAASVNTSGPSEPMPMCSMLRLGQTHSVDPAVRPEEDHLHAKVDNLSAMLNLPVYGLSTSPSERPNISSTLVDCRPEGQQMPQIEAHASLVDVRPPPTYVHGYVGAHPSAYNLSSYSPYNNSDIRISPESMNASQSSSLSAQQSVVHVASVIGVAGVSYPFALAGSLGYPIGVCPPSQNLCAGPSSPRVNGKIGGQLFVPTPHIPIEHYMEESSAGARFQLNGDQSHKAFQVPQITHSPPVQVQGQSTMERLICQPSAPECVVFSEEWVAQQMGNSGDKVSILEDCFMCQKALPHAHSDTLIQERVNPVPETNSALQSHHSDGSLRLMASPRVAGALGEGSAAPPVEHWLGMGRGAVARFQGNGGSHAKLNGQNGHETAASSLRPPRIPHVPEQHLDYDQVPQQQTEKPDHTKLLFTQNIPVKSTEELPKTKPFGFTHVDKSTEELQKTEPLDFTHVDNAVNKYGADDVKPLYDPFSSNHSFFHQEDAFVMPHSQVKQEVARDRTIGIDIPLENSLLFPSAEPCDLDSSHDFATKDVCLNSLSPDNYKTLDGRLSAFPVNSSGLSSGIDQSKLPIWMNLDHCVRENQLSGRTQTSETSVVANVNAVREERLNVQPQVTLDSIRVTDPFSEPGIVMSAGYVNPGQPSINNAQSADPSAALPLIGNPSVSHEMLNNKATVPCGDSSCVNTTKENPSQEWRVEGPQAFTRGAINNVTVPMNCNSETVILDPGLGNGKKRDITAASNLPFGPSGLDRWDLLHGVPVPQLGVCNVENKDISFMMGLPIEDHMVSRGNLGNLGLTLGLDGGLKDSSDAQVETSFQNKLVLEPMQQSHVKSSCDEYIKQELQAVTEDVTASVLCSSTSSVPSASVTGMNGSVLDIIQEGIQELKAQASSHLQIEDINVKILEKPNPGLALSDGIDNLQIIKNSDLEELRELGSGTFGTVYHGKWRGSDVAIKRINDRCFAGKPSEQERLREDFWNEACKLANLHHPNVVAFYGVVLDGPGGTVATVTEYMANGSLRQALQKSDKTLDRRKRLLIAMDVAFGMEYLHGKNIVHFDLKSDNLLVNLRDPYRPVCKVGDLGLSKVKCQTLISGGVRGTLPWMAPELLNGSSNLVSEKVDVFSFGIVMWELLTGDEPYANLHYGAIIGGIVNNTLRPPIPENCDPEWRSLMEKCWSSDPPERPSFTEVADMLRSMAASLPPKGQAQHAPAQPQQPR
ncbi:uncharacterized protein LOC18438588 [Amborella trichopoda]|uniref:Protein kinase domain-containing protein n=1 Tax=Amborella trichopoda TaxID=13333 RepID=W1PT08_AMBTC|nr:uncharacterized protein LOC18438588 [Amborella trichopoda]XP_020525717.1 uncharacterized protein LOC18438588 [Amborella trichopoda]XP_020525718.1 uncharacterized protein LOC18438588 [Amborella trichopoda]ERN10415.1 hypothetical protein AMTR_s00026p00186490 [Amborella trichopoda]|eukprot:XP_006848834.1 uncharacterized protein LOC18438588 [Amborella trichopoda]